MPLFPKLAPEILMRKWRLTSGTLFSDKPISPYYWDFSSETCAKAFILHHPRHEHLHTQILLMRPPNFRFMGQVPAIRVQHGIQFSKSIFGCENIEVTSSRLEICITVVQGKIKNVSTPIAAVNSSSQVPHSDNQMIRDGRPLSMASMD